MAARPDQARLRAQATARFICHSICGQAAGPEEPPEPCGALLQPGCTPTCTCSTLPRTASVGQRATNCLTPLKNHHGYPLLLNRLHAPSFQLRHLQYACPAAHTRTDKRPGPPYLVNGVYAPGVEQDALGERSFARVDVRGNANVADVAQLLLRVLLQRWQRTERPVRTAAHARLASLGKATEG